MIQCSFKFHKNIKILTQFFNSLKVNFNDTEDKLLKLFSINSNLTGHNYIRPFNKYHSPVGSSIFEEVADHVSKGTSVFIDMAQSNESIRNNFVERICRAIFRRYKILA